VKVSGFFAAHTAQFPGGSSAGTFIDTVNAGIAAIGGLFATQVHVLGRLRKATHDRLSARATVAEDVAILLRTVRAVALGSPSVAGRFQRQPGDSDQARLATARAFRDEAQTLTPDLAGHSLPADFLPAFGTHIDALARAIDDQNAAQAEHAGVRAGIAARVKELMAAMKHLDAIVRNQFRGDEETLAAWRQARHIETGPIPAEEPAEAVPPPPQVAGNK
jgi:hypothetical protein